MLLVVLFGGEIGGETEVGRYPPPLTLLEEEELLIAILDRWLAMGASWCLRRHLPIVGKWACPLKLVG